MLHSTEIVENPCHIELLLSVFVVAVLCFCSLFPFFFFLFSLTVLLSLISDGDVAAKPVFALSAVAKRYHGRQKKKRPAIGGCSSLPKERLQPSPTCNLTGREGVPHFQSSISARHRHEIGLAGSYHPCAMCHEAMMEARQRTDLHVLCTSNFCRSRFVSFLVKCW
ncbi:hypothetical protein B0T13DRAFT_311426 [Neurospora crassa]|nr:hypothetical protein B0T13DRAFT_311426 [Neurospora crassa]